MSKVVTVKHKVDLPLIVGADVLAAVERAIEVPAGTYLVEVRLHRGPDGELSLATVTSWARVHAITAAESDAHWARRSGARPGEPAPTINGPSSMEVRVYPARSIRARLAARRLAEREQTAS